MQILKILAEGETEELFSRELLAPHLLPLGIEVQAALLKTRRDRNERLFKGGATSYQKIRKHILELLGKSQSTVFVTTMLDFYALPTTSPGQNSLSGKNGFRQKVEHLEACFAINIANKRFIPHLQVHEFEALMFSDTQKLTRALSEGEAKKAQLDQILRSAHDDPEEINLGKATAPSKRLLKLFPNYAKKLDGLRIAREIGLPTLRAKCKHFNTWLVRLEGIANEKSPKARQR